MNLYSTPFISIKARETLKLLLHNLEDDGVRRVVFYGASDLAEIAYVSLKETSLELVGIVDDYKSGERFLGMTVAHPSTLQGLEYDRIIVTSISSRDNIYDNLVKLDIPDTQISWLESEGQKRSGIRSSASMGSTNVS
jgi:hypothetical protein